MRATCSIARGDLCPRCLAAAPLAYAGHGPVGLTRPRYCPRDEVGDGVDRATEAVVLGSTTAVSSGVAGALGLPYVRWSGATVRDAAQSRRVPSGAGTTYAHVGIATGLRIPTD